MNGQAWRKFEYEIRLSLRSKVNEPESDDESEKEAVFGTFTFLHLLILCNDLDVLHQIATTHSDILHEEVSKQVTIKTLTSNVKATSIVRQDNWIFDANCLHLAAKFMPKGLRLILENLKSPNDLINIGNHNGSTPLHIAATNITSLSTR